MVWYCRAFMVESCLPVQPGAATASHARADARRNFDLPGGALTRRERREPKFQGRDGLSRAVAVAGSDGTGTPEGHKASKAKRPAENVCVRRTSLPRGTLCAASRLSRLRPVSHLRPLRPHHSETAGRVALSAAESDH